MDPADYAPGIDMTGSDADPVESTGASKGHRPADPIWDHFNKRKLPVDKAIKLKRNYDAECKGCKIEVAGKPQVMKRHLSECNKCTPLSQLYTYSDRLWDNPTEVHMRTVCWGQVSDHSQQPESWNEVDVDDTADKAEVTRQVLHDGSFADPPELRLLSKGGAWRKWENCQTLPPGDLKVKVISRKPGTREPGDLQHILKQLTDVMQDNMRLVRLVLRGQLRPVSSSASTKRLEHYRLAAIEYYYGSNADMSKIRCMVTGKEVDSKEITAEHIYRQAWPTGLLKVMGCRLHEPRNIVLMQKQLEKRFDNWDCTIVPEGTDAFRVRVLNPQLLDPKGHEQYITGHAGKGTSLRDVNNTFLHLPTIAHPARRLCGLHATLAVQEADTKGWFDEKHEAPKMSEAACQSPTFDHSLMKKYLFDEAANLFDAETA